MCFNLLQGPFMALIQANNITKNYRVGDLVDARTQRASACRSGEGAFAAFVGRRAVANRRCSSLIGCLDHQSSGTLLVNNDISTLSRSAAASFRGEHLGFVFQDFNLVPGSAPSMKILNRNSMVRLVAEKRREARDEDD